MITATRHHDFSAGHRVVGHESKCRYLHGHNYRVHFTVEAKGLDGIGRVIDFGALKKYLCDYIETEWDHRMLIYAGDPLLHELLRLDPDGVGVRAVPFNPTAENMADYLLRYVGPAVLPSGVKLIEVILEETRKCSATASL